MGDNARKSFFELHWMVQSYNKSIIKEEEARVATIDKDTGIIRRGWTREERLRAVIEDAFMFLGLKPQKPRIKLKRSQSYEDDDDDLLIGPGHSIPWQIARYLPVKS